MIASESSDDLPIVPFSRLRETVEKLEALLANENLVILPGSELARAITIAKALDDAHRGTAALPPDFDAQTDLARALGVAYLAMAIDVAASTKSFANIKHLLKHLTAAGAKPIMTAASEPNASRDTIFELEIASLFAAMGAWVRTAEPDVVAALDGHTWDIA